MSNPQENLTERLNRLLANILGEASPNSLSDVHAAIASLLGPEGSQTNLRDLLGGITREGLADLASLDERLAAIKGIGTRSVADLLTEDYFASAIIQVVGHIGDIKEQLEAIRAAVGAEPYNDLELGTVRGFLNAISRGITQLTSGLPPSPRPGQVSSGASVVQDGRRFARFTPPITGITVYPDGITVEAVGGWLGWEAYVQTTAPEVALNTATDVPNTWLPLAGTGTYQFSVDAAYQIRVYLYNAAANQEEFVWEPFEVEAVATSAGTRYLPSTTKYPVLTWASTDLAPRILNFPLDGWSYTLTPNGVAAWDSIIQPNGGLSNFNPNTGGGTFPSGTRYAVLQWETAPGRIVLRRPQPS